MRRSLTRLLFAAGFVLAGAFFTGCKQDEGERCEVDNDCSAGLKCLSMVCKSGTTPVAPVADASPGVIADAAPAPSGDGPAGQSVATDAVSSDALDGAGADAVSTDTPIASDVSASDSAAADATPVTPDSSSN